MLRLFDPENGGGMLVGNVGRLQGLRRAITLHNNRREYLK
jgi:hypothetical protein